MKTIVVLFLLLSNASWSQESPINIDSIAKVHSFPGKNYIRMTREFRKNGKLKKEMYDDWKGDRIYLRYREKRIHAKYRYNVKWVITLPKVFYP